MINITKETRARVYVLYYQWLDQIGIRNTAKPDGVRYWNAVEKAEAIENEASLLVFGDTNHTATEAYEEKESE
jgi:hypothetical protein